jgi:hypothetical protein
MDVSAVTWSSRSIVEMFVLESSARAVNVVRPMDRKATTPSKHQLFIRNTPAKDAIDEAVM